MKDKDFEERIKNTANLLKAFAEENLSEEDAEEIKNILGGVAETENKDE